jgi:hypothetical protein
MLQEVTGNNRTWRKSVVELQGRSAEPVTAYSRAGFGGAGATRPSTPSSTWRRRPSSRARGWRAQDTKSSPSAGRSSPTAAPVDYQGLKLLRLSNRRSYFRFKILTVSSTPNSAIKFSSPQRVFCIFTDNTLGMRMFSSLQSCALELVPAQRQWGRGLRPEVLWRRAAAKRRAVVAPSMRRPGLLAWWSPPSPAGRRSRLLAGDLAWLLAGSRGCSPATSRWGRFAFDCSRGRCPECVGVGRRGLFFFSR